ncbi:hypothetical protein [Anabaena sp. CCY 9402-a]|uniref:hypothetical protein n=1 Tax=Anabaena sp. CCY 9402-a TaxID=3103867 RepID=UPI0039C64AF9
MLQKLIFLLIILQANRSEVEAIAEEETCNILILTMPTPLSSKSRNVMLTSEHI